MTHNDLPKDMIRNKEQWMIQANAQVSWGYSSGARHLILCTTLPWTSCFMLCMWNASVVMPQRGRMSPSIPLSTLLGKDSSSSAGQCAWKEATLYSSFLSVVQLKGCSPCILVNIRNAALPHPDIICAKGCLPIPHSYRLRARQILAPYDKVQCFTSDIST